MKKSIIKAIAIIIMVLITAIIANAKQSMAADIQKLCKR